MNTHLPDNNIFIISNKAKKFSKYKINTNYKYSTKIFCFNKNWTLHDKYLIPKHPIRHASSYLFLAIYTFKYLKRSNKVP